MMPCTNQQLRISRIKVNLISGHPCLNFTLASGQQSNRLLQGSVTNFLFHKHYEKKKDVLKKSVKCSICGEDAKIGAERNVQFSFYNRVQQKHIMKSHVYICSGEVEGAFYFVFVTYNFSLHHIQVLQINVLFYSKSVSPQVDTG